jgi:hypothetical protein
MFGLEIINSVVFTRTVALDLTNRHIIYLIFVNNNGTLQTIVPLTGCRIIISLM